MADLQKVVVANNEKAKEIARKVLYKAIERTKVDTSKAKSNWRVSIGRPLISEIPAHYLGEGGSTAEESTYKAVSDANNNLDKKKPGQSIFITNNIDYVDAAETDKAYSDALDLGYQLKLEADALAGKK